MLRRHWSRCIAGSIALLLAFAGPARSQGDDHVVMGMPSQAGTSDKNDFLVKREHFVLSYNNKKGTPNWVAWHLTKEHLGDAPRFAFKPDADLPEGLKRVFPADYKNGGFDRGHMCPHSDRSKNDDMSRQTFLMTNMVPQSPENNQKAWNQMELFLRNQVEKHNKECYIVSGPTGVGGEGRTGKKNFIGEKKKVTVPSHTWKVVMIVKAGVRRPEDVDGERTRLIAVIVPNDRTPTFDWGVHRCSIDDVEAQTDLKFFGNVTEEKFLEKKGEIDEISIGPPIPVDHGH